MRVGDKVYLLRATSGRREGPYLVASLSGAGKCTLCLEDGTAVYDGRELLITQLEAAT